jgi:hypothetical protein
VEGDICALCCGTEREVTVKCPLECEYLEEARRHEKAAPWYGDYPNVDIVITDDFLTNLDPLIRLFTISLVTGCLVREEIIDYDVREAVEALIQTYRARLSGLIYETKPTNPMAAFLHEKLLSTIDRFRRHADESGASPLRDKDVLGVLALVQRMEIHHNNGRKKGRAFIDLLRAKVPVSEFQKPAQGVQL